jgi:hypothetical protein
MGFFLEFDEVNNTVRLTFQNTLTTEDINGGAYSALRAFVESRPDCKGIADFSQVTSVDVASRIIQSRARLPPAMPNGKMFVIVAPDDHLFGLSRMFSLHAESTRPHIHVVRSMDQAYRLLGIESPNFGRIENEG